MKDTEEFLIEVCVKRMERGHKDQEKYQPDVYQLTFRVLGKKKLFEEPVVTNLVKSDSNTSGLLKSFRQFISEFWELLKIKIQQEVQHK